jgi:hypothetical protein
MEPFPDTNHSTSSSRPNNSQHQHNADDEDISNAGGFNMPGQVECNTQ